MARPRQTIVSLDDTPYYQNNMATQCKITLQNNMATQDFWLNIKHSTTLYLPFLNGN